MTATDADSCTGTRNYNLTVYGTGADNSANYSGNWYEGSDAGIGFGPWNVYDNYHGEGFAGFSTANVGVNITASDGSVWKLYAINFSADLHQEESTAYRSFNIPLSMAGDACSLSFESRRWHWQSRSGWIRAQKWKRHRIKQHDPERLK